MQSNVVASPLEGSVSRAMSTSLMEAKYARSICRGRRVTRVGSMPRFLTRAWKDHSALGDGTSKTTSDDCGTRARIRHHKSRHGSLIFMNWLKEPNTKA